jgi:hypothetical protein
MGMLDVSTGAPGYQAVANSALVVLFDAFYCRFGVSQLGPPKNYLKIKAGYFTWNRRFCPVFLDLNLVGW